MTTSTVVTPTNRTGGPRRSSRHSVRDGIQKMILSGRHQPGAKLVQMDLAKRFGVAQGVVREALFELQVWGLVETIDNRGVFVSKLNTEKLLESFDVRAVHEGLAARLCCDHATRAELREMARLAEKVYTCARDGKLDEMSSMDRKFHYKLVHLSRSSMLIRLADNYHVLGKIVRADREPEAVRDEHLAILEAIGHGQADQAEKLAKQHVLSAKQTIETKVKDGTFAPTWV